MLPANNRDMILQTTIIVVILFCSCSCKRASGFQGEKPPENTDTVTPKQPDEMMRTTSDSTVSLYITFDAPASNVSTYIPLIKYNKKKCISFQFDDASPSSLATLDKFDALSYSDGCNNKIHYTADVAVNGRAGWDNTEYGSNPSTGALQYADMRRLINKGWDILNHGFYHNDGSVKEQDIFTNGQDALKNISDLHDLILNQLNYKMNCLVVPSGFAGYMIKSREFGYIGATSSNTFDNMEAEGYLWDKWLQPKKLSMFPGRNFTAIQREFALAQWKPSDAPWEYLNAFIKSADTSYAIFGTHGMNASEEALFRAWMDKVASLGDELLFIPMREFLEFEHLR